MTPAEFKAELKRLGLKQIDFARLLQRLSGQDNPNNVTVNRWCLGKQRIPAPAIAFLKVWGELPERKRARIMATAKEG